VKQNCRYGTDLVKPIEANIGLTVTDVRTLAIDSDTPTTFYAGTWGGSVFKSTNSSGSWSIADTGLKVFVVYIIVITPKVPTILYVGTDEGVFVINKME